LEKKSTAVALRYITEMLDNIASVCHDKCSGTSKMVKNIVKVKHINVIDALDAWHVFKSCEKEARVLQKKYPIHLPKFGKKVKQVLRDLLGEALASGKRMENWMFYEWTKLYPSLPLDIQNEIFDFACGYAEDVSRLISLGTSLAESYNNHNLVFFTKRHTYTPQIWRIKMLCAFLQWNEVFVDGTHWYHLLVDTCVARISSCAPFPTLKSQ